MKRISLRAMVVLLVCLAITLVTTAGVLAVRPATAPLQALDAGLPSAALASAALLSAPAVVIGTVTHDVAYRERAFPMGNSTRNTSQALTIRLMDLTGSASEPMVLGEEIIYIAGNPPPYVFAIRHDPTETWPEGAYALTAEIAVDGVVMFTASAGPVVLQRGTPTQVVLVLKAVDLQRSAGLPAGIERLARFSY